MTRALKRVDGRPLGARLQVADAPSEGQRLIWIEPTITEPAAVALREGLDLLQAAPTAIGIVRNRVLGWCNAPMADLLGYGPYELHGRSARLIYADDEVYKEVGRAYLEQIATSGTAVLQTTFRRRDGRLLDVHLAFKVVDPAEPDLLVFSVLDITALRRAEERYSRLVNHLPIPLVTFEKLQITFANAAAARLVGAASPEALVGVQVQSLIDEKETAAWPNAAADLGSGHATALWPHRVRRLDGRWVPVETVAFPIEEADRRVVVAVSMDVEVRDKALAERARYEARVASQHRIAQAFLTELGEGAVFTAITAEVQTALLSAAGFVGYLNEAGELICPGMNPRGEPMTFPPRSFSGVWGRALTEGRALCANEPQVVPFGHRSILRAMAAPIRHHGHLLGLIVVGNKSVDYDETDFAELESLAAFLGPILSERLARRHHELDRERLAKAVEQSAEAVVIADPLGVIRYVNRAFEAMSGYETDEAVGNHVMLLGDGGLAKESLAQIQEALESGTIWSGHLVGRKKNQERFDTETTVSPIRTPNGRLCEFVAVSRDVTKERALEAQLHQALKMEAVGKLVASVAHDFNNCLSPILGWADLLLLDLPEPSPLKTPLEAIRVSALSASELTRQLLAFSRKRLADIRLVDLNALIRRFEPMLDRITGERISLKVRLTPGCAQIKVDASRIEQVLMNLAVNAVDAMPHGGCLLIETVRIWLDPSASQALPGLMAGDHVLLRVKDTGQGMDSSLKAQIFDPFFTTKEKGTGLGLSMVYATVHQHGGHIHVDSVLGSGTTFHIYLPVADEDLGQLTTPPPAPLHLGMGRTVMVVEDEPGVRTLVVELLTRAGFAVKAVAENGESALRLADGLLEPVELLVSDVTMPGISGPETYDLLRARWPELEALFISGYPDQEARLLGSERPIHLLRKPFDRESLMRSLYSVLRRSH